MRTLISGFAINAQKICAVTAIMPDMKKDNANFVRMLIRQGLKIKLVDVEYVRNTEHWCNCREKAKEEAAKKAKRQEVLFEGVEGEAKKSPRKRIYLFTQTWEIGVIAESHEAAEKALSEHSIFTEDRSMISSMDLNCSDDYIIFGLDGAHELDGLYTKDGEYHEGEDLENLIGGLDG